MSKYTSLQDIVYQTIDVDLGGDQSKFATLLSIAVRGLKDLNLSGCKGVKTKSIAIESNYSADLPNDLVRPIRVGIECNGRCVFLGYAEDIKPVEQLEESNCSCEEAEKEIVEYLEDGKQPCCQSQKCDCPGNSYAIKCAFNNFSYLVSGSHQLGRKYASGRGYQHLSYWKYDEEGCKILFDTRCPLPVGTKLILEYVSSSEDMAKMVPAVYTEALFDFIRWKYFASRTNKMHVSESAKADYFKRKEREIPELTSNYSIFDMVEAICGPMTNTVR